MKKLVRGYWRQKLKKNRLTPDVPKWPWLPLGLAMKNFMLKLVNKLG